MSDCALCREPLAASADVRAFARDELAHRECLLRSAVGGIGHLTNHAHWCQEIGDPDGGLSYRASALAVDQWIADNGFSA